MKVQKILFLVVLLAVPQLAAQAQSMVTLTFEEAVKIGLERNVILNQQKNQLLTNQAQKLNGISNFIPNVNVTGQAQRQEGQQQNTTTGDLEDLTTDYAGMQVNANVTLFNGFRNVNTLFQANNQLMAQSYLVQRSSQDVVSTVATQYLQVLLDQELLRIAQENLQTQKTLLEQTQGFFDVGSRAITDVYNQDAQMKTAQVAAIRARNTLENDKSILAQTLQLDPTQDFQVTYPALNSNADYQHLALDSLIEIANQHRPDLKQLNHQVAANKSAYQATFSGFVPTVSLFANYGSFYYSLIPYSFSEQFTNRNPSLSYGVNLSIPIFARFQGRTQRVAAKVTYDNSALNKQNLEKTVKIDVLRAMNNIKNALENYESSLAQAQAGELALRTQQESFQLGISSQVELAQANQTYVQGAAAKAQAEVTLVFQKILLDYALGTLTPSDYQ